VHMFPFFFFAGASHRCVASRVVWPWGFTSCFLNPARCRYEAAALPHCACPCYHGCRCFKTTADGQRVPKRF
jgi:hypothetical protein